MLYVAKDAGSGGGGSLGGCCPPALRQEGGGGGCPSIMKIWYHKHADKLKFKKNEKENDKSVFSMDWT